VVPDPTLRHHTAPIRHICVVSEREYAGRRELCRKEGLGPWLGRVAGGPRLFPVAGQTVDEDDAVQDYQSDVDQ
jgi:hypothetical protein